MGYTNSPLITYTKISPNKTSPRNHIIDTITIHCMAGNLSIERCGDVFAPSSRKASSNYGVGSDGRIALYVDEKDRSWCSSNATNDHRAVTIEVANDGGAPDWHVSDKAMAALINLVSDICKRNNIKKLIWSTNKNDRVNHLNGCNMTVHRDYATKACPGNYLYSKHTYIAEEVNKKLGTSTTSTPPPQIPSVSTPISVSKLKITANIKSVQLWLNRYYTTNLVVDGIYGSKTKVALVKAWQTEVGGLTIDGVFGQKSKTASSSHNIKKGSTGILVTIWQAYLVCSKYNPNGIDGSFGTGCHAATVTFQKANGLAQDGQVGKNTWSKAFG